VSHIVKDNILERAIDWIFSHPEELNAPAVVPSVHQAPAASSQAQYSDGSGRKFSLCSFVITIVSQLAQ